MFKTAFSLAVFPLVLGSMFGCGPNHFSSNQIATIKAQSIKGVASFEAMPQKQKMEFIASMGARNLFQQIRACGDNTLEQRLHKDVKAAKAAAGPAHI